VTEIPGPGPHPIVDLQVQFLPPGVEERVTVPREAFRDAESLAAWPSKDVVNYLFGAKKGINHELALLLAELDHFGVVHAFIPVTIDTLEPTISGLGAEADRFSFILKVNPHDGMGAVRDIETAVTTSPRVRAVHIAPHQLYPPLPPDSREYYPVYAKCIERGLPVTLNVGYPGPRIPAQCQHPRHLEHVLWFFPELTVIMKHGGEPWVDECVKLMVQWPNAYFMTSGFAPKRYPKAIVDYAAKRGRGKVMFAGYWPRLAYQRLADELAALPLGEDAAHDLVSRTAQKVFGLDLP
jgi:hypothetical protein